MQALASENERSSCRRAAQRRAERREPAYPRELEQNGAPPTTLNQSVTGIAVCMGRVGEACAGAIEGPANRTTRVRVARRRRARRDPMPSVLGSFPSLWIHASAAANDVQTPDPTIPQVDKAGAPGTRTEWVRRPIRAAGSAVPTPDPQPVAPRRTRRVQMGVADRCDYTGSDTASDETDPQLSVGNAASGMPLRVRGALRHRAGRIGPSRSRQSVGRRDGVTHPSRARGRSGTHRAGPSAVHTRQRSPQGR